MEAWHLGSLAHVDSCLVDIGCLKVFAFDLHSLVIYEMVILNANLYYF
jgi:hypothetical protein